MRKFTMALALSAAVLMAACSRPKETVIPSDMSAWDKDLAPVVQKLDDEDKKLFVAYIARMKMAEVLTKGQTSIPFGTTVGQAIEDQKNWAAAFQKRQAEQKAEQERKDADAAALKQKLDAERAATTKRINDAVTVTLVSKKEVPSDIRAGRISDTEEFTVGIQNNTQKDIVGVSGALEFIDVFDKVVGRVYFEVSETMKPGTTHRWTGTRDYNEFLPEQRAVWNLEEGKYKTRFVPRTLVFADGEKISMPE